MPHYQFGPELIQDWDLTFEDFEDDSGKTKKKDSSRAKQPPEVEPEIAEAE